MKLNFERHFDNSQYRAFSEALFQAAEALEKELDGINDELIKMRDRQTKHKPTIAKRVKNAVANAAVTKNPDDGVEIIPPKSRSNVQYTENLKRPSRKAKKTAWNAAVESAFKH